MMEVFRFKEFAVRNDQSAMKVNTDGVLLGAAMTILPSDTRLLDIGTGTGTIALMAAQRLSKADFGITAIDIDENSANEAAANFADSPWSSHLHASCISLQDFAKSLERDPNVPADSLTVPADSLTVPADCKSAGSVIAESLHTAGLQIRQNGAFDLIFSNPPFFENSLKAPDPRRRAARHADTMSHRDITAFASARLSPAGHLSMILPAEAEKEAVRYAASFGLRLFRIIRIKSTPRRSVSRIIAEWTRSAASSRLSSLLLDQSDLPSRLPFSESSDSSSLQLLGRPVEEELTIQDAGDYTAAYRALVHDFLLI